MKRDLPKYVYRKSGKYLYFMRGNISQRIMAAPGSDAFWREYSRLLNGDVSGEKRRTVQKLIDNYMQSHTWAKKAANTKKSYEKSFRYFLEKIPRVDPAAIRRHHVIEMRDALAETPTTANRRVGALSVLMEHAIDIGWLERNHAKGVSQLEGTRKREAWPQDMVEAFRETAEGEVALLFEVLIGTGQRIGDVLKMQWGHIEDGGITVKQGKTKAEVWIPFTARLEQMLRDTHKRSLYLISQPNGRPVSYQLAWKWIREVRVAIGAEKWDIHALRHYAASELAGLNLDDDHIMAITGHQSKEMVRLYTGKAAQKARARKAQEKRK